MNGKRILFLVIAVALFLNFISLPELHARGHDGFYAGIGYNQLFMFTTEHRLGAATSSRRITFSPGYGANVLIGYDFDGSRWGVQFPFEFSRIKLNKTEWVNQYTPSVEGVFHLVEWNNGVDIHLLGGMGFSYLSEGKIDDNSSCSGMTMSFGPGLSYYFSRTDKISAALNFEVPFRWIYYFGDHLSADGTSLIAIPMLLSIQVGF